MSWIYERMSKIFERKRMTFDWKLASSTLDHTPDETGLPVGLPIENWQPCLWPSGETLQGRYCSLEAFDVDSHAAELFAAFATDRSEANWVYLPYGPFDTVDDFHIWCQSECVKKDPLFYSVLDKQTAKLVGMASYLRITPNAGVIEVGHIHFSPLMQGTRMSTEAMYLMMSQVFDELGYRRYEWKCDALNAPSARAAQRLGFQFEGIFRQATVYKGRNRDTAWFSITDNEWPRLRDGYQRWLAVENFDSNDRQIRSLAECISGS